MFDWLAAGTTLYRVTDIGRSWNDVISGNGAYYTFGNRYNRIQQRTVYAALDPFVSLAESAAHKAIDHWQPSIGGDYLHVSPPLLQSPVPPLVSEHWLWSFTTTAGLQLLRLEDPQAEATFGFHVYELLSPSVAYRRTADLADRIRRHPCPNSPRGRVDGILAPSVRTPATSMDLPKQVVLFLPVGAQTIGARQRRRWRLQIEFRDCAGQSVNARTRDIDWSNPWFQLSASRASVPAFPPRSSIRPGDWHQFGIKYA